MASNFNPLSKKDAASLIVRRHAEWVENQKRWRFFQDSLEGGNRYRHADYQVDPTSIVGAFSWLNLGVGSYGWDPMSGEAMPISYGQISDRNLVPHLSELGTDGRDLYMMRLHRTPVPMLVQWAIRSHMNRIYSKEVRRDGPISLQAWWEDVDGSGQNIRRFMTECVAPLFMVMGQLDLVCDHPKPPEGVMVTNEADRISLGLDACVAGIILPENMVWWELNRRTKLYSECLVFERCDDGPRYRHWTGDGCYVYDPDGEFEADESYPYAFGRPPIVRVFDTRKVRSGNVGQSRYEEVAELQKALYNADSERILADCMHSHPRMQGPEDFLQKGVEIPIGPGNILPMKRVTNGGVVTYQGFSFLEPPQAGLQGIRQHMLDFEDRAVQSAALMRPSAVTTPTTVAQSGVSKMIDNVPLNAMLAEVSSSLEDVETALASVALTVQFDRPPTLDELASIRIDYPKEYDLYSATDLLGIIQELQAVMALSGQLPVTETEIVHRLMQIALPGLPDERQQAVRDEIEAFVKARGLINRATEAEAGTEVETESGGRIVVDSALMSPPA